MSEEFVKFQKTCRIKGCPARFAPCSRDKCPKWIKKDTLKDKQIDLAKRLMEVIEDGDKSAYISSFVYVNKILIDEIKQLQAELGGDKAQCSHCSWFYDRSVYESCPKCRNTFVLAKGGGR